LDKYNFIVLAPNRWEDVWMNRQHLFSIIGKEHNVVYANAPFYYWDRKLKRYKAAPFWGSNRYINNVLNIEFTKLLLRIPKLPILDTFIKSIFIKKVSAHLEPAYKTILYVFNPIYGEYIKDIKHDFLIYHPYDDFEHLYSDDIAKGGEQALVESANLMFTTSKMLQDKYKKRRSNPSSVYFVPNGVDYSLFSDIENTITGVNQKSTRIKVGYTGSINAKIDIYMLYQVFKELDNCDFYVTGSEGKIDSFQVKAMENLKSLSNVYFLGNKKLIDVPSYMNAMDINVIPYRTDPDSFANAGYPLKLHEYLTVGKPIISSPIDSAFEFESVISIKAGAAAWVEEIKRISAATDCDSDKICRRSVAKENTWGKRVDTILSTISRNIMQ